MFEILFVILFTVKVNSQDFLVYPNPIPTLVPNIKEPLYAPSICPENHLLYPGSQKDDWICDCAPGFVYYPKEDGCFPVYRQGPCDKGQYLILRANEFVPKCVKNPCGIDGVVEYKRICHPLEKPGGPCMRKNKMEPITVLTVVKSTLKLQCVTGTSS